MSRFLEMTPASDAELFDMLHGLFGLGDYDDQTAAWFEHRMVEISKIKAMRAKRQLTIEEIALAARYCYRKREHITASWQIPPFIVAARREAKANAQSQIEVDIAQAAAVETDPEWVHRLLNARGPYREQVLQEWRTR